MAAGLAGFAVLSLLAYLLIAWMRRNRESTSLALLAAMVALVAAFVVFAVANLRAPGLSLQAVVGLEQPDIPTQVQAELASHEAADRSAAADEQGLEPSDVPWQQTLVPRGTKTRIGDAVRALVNKERGGPIAGIVVMTDGGNNAGMDCDVSARTSQAAGIPILSVGLGSDRQPVNARVVDLEAPKRVYPGDKFNLTGYVQAYGLEGRLVTVELSSAPVDAQADASQDTERESQLRGRTIDSTRRRRRGCHGQV